MVTFYPEEEEEEKEQGDLFCQGLCPSPLLHTSCQTQTETWP